MSLTRNHHHTALVGMMRAKARARANCSNAHYDDGINRHQQLMLAQEHSMVPLMLDFVVQACLPETGEKLLQPLKLTAKTLP